MTEYLPPTWWDHPSGRPERVNLAPWTPVNPPQTLWLPEDEPAQVDPQHTEFESPEEDSWGLRSYITLQTYGGDATKVDMVNHPPHYTSDPSGVEQITITRHRNFNIGNAIKYLWRAGLKDEGNQTKHIEDLKKAVFYIHDEIKRLGGTP